jgi:hypothetical protein
MHRKKEEVILRILAQESLVLELGWKDMQFWSFGAIFVDFSEARDLFGNIFQIPGPNYKIMDCGLIFTNGSGLIANRLGFRIFPDLFCYRNSTVDRGRAWCWCDAGGSRLLFGAMLEAYG